MAHHTLILFSLVLALPYAIPVEIDNSLLGEPEVDCQDTMVSLTFKTQKPFTGRIYVKGLADDDRCSRNFATNQDQDKFSMMIGQGDCNMQRTRNTGGPLEGLVFSLVIVVSFHGTFVTKADRAFRCMCFFRNIKRVTNFLDMSMIGTTELMDTAKMPTCTYTIHSGSPDGPLVRYAKIGDKIFHTWQCDDPEQGFLVHSCWVNDGRGNRFDLLDVDGCAIDPIIQPDVNYEETLTRAFVETHGYKFSDTSVLDYQCVLELCKKAQGECTTLTPPTCGRGKRSLAKRSLEIQPISVEMKENEMDLLAGVNIIDTLDEDASVSGPPPEFIKSLNRRLYHPRGRLLGSGFEPDPQMCFSTPAFVMIVSLTLLLLVAAVTASTILCLQAKQHKL